MKITNHKLNNTEFKKSPNQGGEITPKYIILHDTAGSLKKGGSVDWLCNPVAKASAHVVIEHDGTIVQLVDFNKKAWHAGKSFWMGKSNLNDFSIGIEIVNPGKLSLNPIKGFKEHFDTYKSYFNAEYKSNEYDIKSTPKEFIDSHGEGYWMNYPEVQLQAVKDLCRELCDIYGIEDIIGHYHIAPKRKVDPNPLMDFARIKQFAFGRNSEFHYDAYCKTNLNLRKEPTTKVNNVAKVLPEFTKVDVVDELDDWVRVMLEDNSTGWVVKKYLKFI